MADKAEPKVTVAGGDAVPSPSEQMVRDALKETVLTLEDGRRVTMRKPGILAQFRLAEAMGPDLAANQTWMQMVQPFIYVAAIDGEPVFLPGSKLEMEALISGLGEDGMGQVMAWYVTNVIGPTNDAIERAKRQAEEAAALKN